MALHRRVTPGAGRAGECVWGSVNKGASVRVNGPPGSPNRARPACSISPSANLCRPYYNPPSPIKSVPGRARVLATACTRARRPPMRHTRVRSPAQTRRRKPPNQSDAPRGEPDWSTHPFYALTVPENSHQRRLGFKTIRRVSDDQCTALVIFNARSPLNAYAYSGWQQRAMHPCAVKPHAPYKTSSGRPQPRACQLARRACRRVRRSYRNPSQLSERDSVED
jgi:hypothetical protein